MWVDAAVRAAGHTRARRSLQALIDVIASHGGDRARNVELVARTYAAPPAIRSRHYWKER